MDQNGAIIRAEIRFYAGLNRYLPRDRHGLPLTVDIAPGSTINLLLAEFGVPREAVHLILCNGQQVKSDSVLQQNDRIALYPAFNTLNIDA